MSDLMDGFQQADQNAPAASMPEVKTKRRTRTKEEILADLDKQEQRIKARREAVLHGRATVRFTLGTPEEKADFNRFVLAVGKDQKLTYAALAALLQNSFSELSDEEKESLTTKGKEILQEHHRERQPRKKSEA